MHMYNDPSDRFGIYLGFILIAFGACSVLWRRYSVGRLVRKDPSAQLADSQSDSAILSFYSSGHTLLRAGKGTLNGMNFASYLSSPDTDPASGYVNDFAFINVLDLPFNTDTHLIGLSKEHEVDRIKFGNFLQANGMEPVILEGDFSKYFDLYAAKGEQVDVRTVLDPKAMAYVVDFCKSHFWEINRAEMYFVASSSDKHDNNIFKAAAAFVDEVKPALRPGQSGAPVVHHEVAYGEYDGPPLACPVCKATMTNNDLWHACPAGHGFLMSGRELGAIHAGKLKLEADPTKTKKHDILTCPNCHNPMTRVDYQGGGVQIDSCEYCPYRWIDATDAAQLATGKIVPRQP
jgi:Zn-finger nucleic acid-binding protein